MDFSGIKAITIPEGSVKKITANGVTLWEKISFVNQIPLSITSTGAQYVGDNGEDGYRKNYRLNSSGVEAAAADVCVTGFIAAKRGDTIYFENIKTATNTGGKAEYSYLCLYNKSFANKRATKFNGLQNSALAYIFSDITVDSSGYITSVKVKDTYNEFLTDAGGYIRISAEGINDNSIISINQPIK